MSYMAVAETSAPNATIVANQNILVIDDESDWLQECQFMLGSLGHNATTAATPDEALLRLRDRSISIVIIDYNMPGIDGLSLIQQLSAQAQADGRQLRFIMATGYASLDIAVAAMRASVVDFLQKPVSRDQLQKALLRVHGVELETPARTALVDQLSSLSAEMQRLSSLIGNPIAAPTSPVDGRADRAGLPGAVDPSFIRTLLRNEAKRRKLGNGALFGDPAWDMLLDLMIAKLERRHVSVSSACIASGAPTTTALRLVNRLVNDGILCRIPDERDGRRDFLAIDPTIEEAMLSYLGELAKAG